LFSKGLGVRWTQGDFVSITSVQYLRNILPEEIYTCNPFKGIIKKESP